jgi:cation transport ATPase
MDDRRHATEALASIHDHQESARRHARNPWWVYAAMFVLIAGATAADDVVTLTGAKVIALLVLVAFTATLVITFATGSAPLSAWRGVQRRQAFAPRAFVIIAVLGAVIGWLLIHYSGRVAGHLGGHPGVVLGLLYGAVFTGLFALSQRLSATR